jgi:hypothetical protein
MEGARSDGLFRGERTKTVPDSHIEGGRFAKKVTASLGLKSRSSAEYDSLPTLQGGPAKK